MLIRDIEQHEVPLLIAGARQFFIEGKLFGELNETSFVTGWQNFLKSGIGVLLGAFDGGRLCGAIGGSVFPDFPTGDLVASEFFWYCVPESRGAGLRLFKAFEQRAAERKAVRIIMVHLANLNDGPMSKLFARYGYEFAEKVYIKKL